LIRGLRVFRAKRGGGGGGGENTGRGGRKKGGRERDRQDRHRAHGTGRNASSERKTREGHAETGGKKVPPVRGVSQLALNMPTNPEGNENMGLTGCRKGPRNKNLTIRHQGVTGTAFKEGKKKKKTFSLRFE